MEKVIIFISILLYSLTTFGAENTAQDILNDNRGMVGNVTINQSNSISNDQVVSEQKINALIEKALEVRKNGGSPNEVKEANQIASFFGLADEVNKMQATNQQKNEICKSRAKVSAEIFSYHLGFIFKKCDDVFIMSSQANHLLK